MDFEWDYAFVFITGEDMLTLTEISRIIGSDYTGRISQDTCGMVFLNDGEIIYYETHTFTPIGFGDVMPPRILINFSPMLREEIGLQTRYSFFRPDDIFRIGHHEAGGNRNSRRINSYYWIYNVSLGNETIQG